MTVVTAAGERRSALNPLRIQAAMDAAVSSGKLAGLSVSVLHGPRQMDFVRGVADLQSGLPVGPDTVFQIGSVTKAMTATLIMQAAHLGLVDLDTPAAGYLGVPLGHDPRAAGITVGQLLSHSSGLDGDMFEDVGADDACLEKYARLAERLDLMSPPGQHYNYCNAGYALLGRIVETAFGDLYDNVLKTRLFEPMQAAVSASLAEDIITRTLASGHEPDADGKLAVMPPVAFPRALGPAGLTVWSNAADLVRFAALHMKLKAHEFFPAEMVDAMQKPQITLPDGTHWAYGWKLIPGGDVMFVGHDGGTIGHTAFLWFAPSHGIAVALCANGDGKAAFQDIAWPIFEEVCGAAPILSLPPFTTPARPIEAYAGAYTNAGVTMTVAVNGTDLMTSAHAHHFDQPDSHFPMRAIGGDLFRATIGDDDSVVTAFFDTDAAGHPDLFYAGRLYRRVKG